MALPYESVTVARSGDSLLALIDPRERQIYLTQGSDVLGGDLLGFRGLVRRVTAEPALWAGAGLVASYEDSPILLPDLGQVLRGAGGVPVLNEATGVLSHTAGLPIWTGPCRAEAAEAQSVANELGEQRVGIVPYLLTVPLALVDVRAGDQFKVTQSRDQRLVTRLLTITAVRGSSSAPVRELVAFDNQGGV